VNRKAIGGMITSLKLAAVVAETFGLSKQTVFLHVKNLQKRAMLSAAGRGFNAAHMRPIDASRIILAAAGSRLVKETVDTVKGFGKLRPTVHAGRSGPGIMFEDHLAGMLTEIAARSNFGQADPGGAESSAFASISLFSAFDTTGPLPRAAVARRATERGIAFTNFAGAGRVSQEISVEDYAQTLGFVGLVQQAHVTAGALERIALAL
jgi:hypothetical protein